MTVTFIGDVHGKFGQYKTLLKKYPNTIQVGDMGVGFLNWPHGDPQQNPPHDLMVETNAFFIRGNHDNPHVCKRHSRYLPDGYGTSTKQGNMMMFIGGGYSIDRHYRREGFTWWPEEELSYDEACRIADVYHVMKPTVMVTHECPSVHTDLLYASHHRFDSSRTEKFLQTLWEAHKPQLWIHGHHHLSVEHNIQGTKFVCLAELEAREFNI